MAIQNYLYSQEKFKDNWGIYEIRHDSIFLKGWDAAQEYPVYEREGVFNNVEEFIIIKSRCYSCSKLEYGHSWRAESLKYECLHERIIADSTTKFIQPLRGN